MKQLIKIAAFALAVALVAPSCSDDTTELDFSIDTSGIEQTIGPDGGERNMKVTSSGKWSVVTDATWIKVSPSNGRGTTDCVVQVDSTVLADRKRLAKIFVISDDQIQPLDFKIEQEGYPLEISVLDEKDIELPNYGEWGKRTFEVRVKTNVPFEVKIPGDKPWVLCEEVDVESKLNRGARPRIIPLVFKWENNTRPEERNVDVDFEPKQEEELTQQDKLHIKQFAAEKIEPGIKGDSLAILACVRSLNLWSKSGYEGKMGNWQDVVLWEATDEEVINNNELLGRVRSLKISMFQTEEGIPFEIQYLTALEELSLFSNANKYRLEFPTGPYLAELTQLKKLQIYSFGLSEMEESFKNLVNLERLDLSGNNFEDIPDILTPENFPNLKYLNLGNNRRRPIGDMTAPFVPQDMWGGLYKATPNSVNSPNLKRLLKWENLETLILNNNFMQYGIPDMLSEPGMPVYQSGDMYRWKWNISEEEWEMKPVPSFMHGKPKVLPNTLSFSIHLNYMTGRIPDWILYHPMLMWWVPDAYIFYQQPDYVDMQGNKLGFNNVPQSPDYYYKVYPEQVPEDVEQD